MPKMPPKPSKKGHIPPQFLAHMKHKGDGPSMPPAVPKAFPPKRAMTVPPLNLAPVPDEDTPARSHMGATSMIHKKHVKAAHSAIHGTPKH